MQEVGKAKKLGLLIFFPSGCILQNHQSSILLHSMIDIEASKRGGPLLFPPSQAHPPDPSTLCMFPYKIPEREAQSYSLNPTLSSRYSARSTDSKTYPPTETIPRGHAGGRGGEGIASDNAGPAVLRGHEIDFPTLTMRLLMDTGKNAMFLVRRLCFLWRMCVLGLGLSYFMNSLSLLLLLPTLSTAPFIPLSLLRPSIECST